MKNGFDYQGGLAELSGGSFGNIQGNLEYGKQAGNAAVYMDLGATQENGWQRISHNAVPCRKMQCAELGLANCTPA
jgi:hypothetical protein